jgi:hypothetical protein
VNQCAEWLTQKLKDAAPPGRLIVDMRQDSLKGDDCLTNVNRICRYICDNALNS